ncbi:hypothetical protein V6Z12_A11G269400 [Gossypium hirsutum]|uniref:Disease resistance protein At4g27190 isoform X1 n=1 Tax=Gossypium hirsutum TaxID=3635 RepID=A0ABM2Z553_GOSHI|nr:disease resistance protein At4g27190-like isoform X1 [Gossypium hirsutum]
MGGCFGKELSGNVHSAIEMSYNYLEREELKGTFLLCSIMGHNAATEDLLKYCRGLGLFRGLDTIEKVRRRVLTLVSELKDSSLLLAGSSPERFDMHDVVCEVAIAIASRDRGWLASGKEDVSEEWSDKDRMRTCSLVSLQNTEVIELLDESECPKLTFFFMGSENSSSKMPFFFSMGGVDSSLKIPKNLFEGMKGLKVLNFTGMNLTSLPCSIGCLKTLCTLRLVGCALKDIGILGELVNLEILDLRNSTIRVLPKEIGELRRLKLLDLSGCRNLEVISPNVLSSLSRLEELYLYDSFNGWDWEVEGSENNPRSKASLVELQNLSRLTTLEVHVPDVRAIPKQKLFSRNMERYKISIGEFWSRYDGGMETSRMLKLTTNNRSLQLAHEIKTLLRRTQDLYLRGVEDAMEMLYDPITEGFPHLKHLKVCDVSDIKCVINPSMLVSFLESLFLEGLMNLEAICDG